jgi:hypothetical protein
MGSLTIVVQRTRRLREEIKIGLQLRAVSTARPNAERPHALLVGQADPPSPCYMDLRLHAIWRHFESEIESANALLKLKGPADQWFKIDFA